MSEWLLSLALIVRHDGLVGIKSDTTFVLRYGYNLRNNPVLEADILIQILVQRFIRNQIHRIGVYPYPISPRNAYPDNPWFEGWCWMRCHVQASNKSGHDQLNYVDSPAALVETQIRSFSLLELRL